VPTDVRRYAYRYAAALLGAALITAGPAQAKKEEPAPYVYGPPPDWAQFRRLAEAEVRARLFDPDSAKFEWPHGYKKGFYKPFLSARVNGYVTCGLVNSRNRMGGYVGRTYFAVVEDNGAVAYLEIGGGSGSDMLSNSCANAELPPPPADAAGTGGPAPLGVDFLATTEGAAISAVTAGGPGDRAGLKPGMVVAKVNGIAVKGMSADLLRQLLAGIDGAATLELTSGAVIKVAKP
jgi:PDZ domain